jgi:hypothetical protein
LLIYFFLRIALGCQTDKLFTLLPYEHLFPSALPAPVQPPPEAAAAVTAFFTSFLVVVRIASGTQTDKLFTALPYEHLFPSALPAPVQPPPEAAAAVTAFLHPFFLPGLLRVPKRTSCSLCCPTSISPECLARTLSTSIRSCYSCDSFLTYFCLLGLLQVHKQTSCSRCCPMSISSRVPCLHPCKLPQKLSNPIPTPCWTSTSRQLFTPSTSQVLVGCFLNIFAHIVFSQ